VPPSAPQAAIFDFDLTLADSTAGFLDCHRFAAAAFGLPPPERDQVLATVGTPLPLAFPILYGPGHADRCEAYIQAWQARADAVMNDLTVMLDGAAGALAALSAEGAAMAIVSQKFRRRVEATLHRDGLIAYFGVVVGGEDIAELKPDPEGLLKAASALGVRPGAALYIGDTVIDAQAAANAGMRFVAVLSGVTGAAAFAPFAPLAVLRDVAGLPTLWRDLRAGGG
jgi:phosphoglycolate phosphatase